MARQYEVWTYNRSGFFPKEGWDFQVYDNYREALAEAKSEKYWSEEVRIDVYEDGDWVNDHLEQKLIRTKVIA